MSISWWADSLFKQRSPVIPLFVAAAFLTGACGYRFGTGWSMPEGVERIHVAVMKNLAHEPGVETVFSNYLIDELNRYTTVRVSSEATADAVLDGKLTSLRVRAASSENAGLAIENRITMAVSLSLTRKTGEILWMDNSLLDSETYRIGANVSETEHLKRQAVDTLSERLAQKAFERLTLSAQLPAASNSGGDLH